MSAIRQNFRKWWQPPRSAQDREKERSVTFLELFYDLVYVVIIAELAHALAEHLTWQGVGEFAFLFIIVWWAWLNGTTYHDIHGNNDIRTRVFTFLQMFTVAAMAVFAHNAMGEGSVGFALSYAGFQLILTYLWWRTGVHDPNHRPLAQPYTIVFLITTFLFVVSIFVPAPWRFYMWGFAVLLSLLLPLYMFSVGKNDPVAQAEIDRIVEVSPSLVERFGLLTIIVLGEVVVGTIRGVSEHHHFTLEIGVTAVLGMSIAIGLWWIYFDFVSHRIPRAVPAIVTRWMYLHLFLTMGIAATGTAVFNVVEHAGEPLASNVQWLLVSAIALALICTALLMQSIHVHEDQYQLYRRGGIVTLVMSVLILLLGIPTIPTIPFLLILIIFMLVPVFYGIKVWIQVFNAEEIPID